MHNYLLPQIILHKKKQEHDRDIPMSIQVHYKHSNVADLPPI